MRINLNNQEYLIGVKLFDDSDVASDYKGKQVNVSGNNLDIKAKIYDDEPCLYVIEIGGEQAEAKAVIKQVAEKFGCREIKILTPNSPTGYEPMQWQ